MKVSELTIPQLNRWVAKALGWEQRLWGAIPVWFDPNDEGRYRCHVSQWNPSAIWSQGGAIVERDKITLEPSNHKWYACYGPRDTEPMWVWEEGDTALIAAMRCVVVSKFGETVDDSQAD
jgi:hypothetical protein